MSTLLITLSLLFTGLAFTVTEQPEKEAGTVAEPDGALIHTVFFWFHDGVSSSDGELFYSELKKLKEIPDILQGWIGVPASTEERGVIDNSYDYSITFVFEDEAAEAAYQVHPIHSRFVEENNHLWERVVVYDAVSPER